MSHLTPSPRVPYSTRMGSKAKRRRSRRPSPAIKSPHGAIPDASADRSWHSTRDALITAVGFASAVASLSALSLATALLATGAIALALGLLLPHRHIKIGLIPGSAMCLVVATLLFLGVFGTTPSRSSSRVDTQSTGNWSKTTPQLAAPTAPVGVYPGRAARLCVVIASCSTGALPDLDALVFREGNVF